MIELGLIFLYLAVGVAGQDWWAVAREDKRREYVLKPLVMTLLFVAAALLGSDDSGRRVGFTLAAIALSAAGDVFLMLRRRRFLAGLTAFLLAHVAYVVAFDTFRADLRTITTFGVVLVLGAGLYVRLVRGMRARGELALAVPVGLYNVAIAAMVTSALLTVSRPGWAGFESGIAIAGALLFMISDTLIGWTRFVRSFRRSEVAITVTYHLAQVLLVLALLR